MKPRPWTDAEDACLRISIQLGRSLESIGVELGRSISSVSSRARKQGLGPVSELGGRNTLWGRSRENPDASSNASDAPDAQPDPQSDGQNT